MIRDLFNVEDTADCTLILAFIVIKHCCRRLFGVLPFLRTAELRDRMMFLTEHVMFSFWALHCVYYVPEMTEPGSSW